VSRLALAASLVFVLGEIGVLVGAYLDPAVASAAVVGAVWIAAGAILYLALFRTAAPTSRAD